LHDPEIDAVQCCLAHDPVERSVRVPVYDSTDRRWKSDRARRRSRGGVAWLRSQAVGRRGPPLARQIADWT
jgi:hypothetical protein